MKTSTRELVDPRFFAQLDNLEWIARSVVEGFLHGLHRSPYVGFSVEFASHRAYTAGDDLRHLNWKLFGRHEKLYVKQYDAETNLDCHLVLDVSRSMEMRTGAVSKLRYGTCLAAALAHLALRQRDAVGVTLFADRVLEHVKPRSQSNQLDEVLHAIVRTAARPRADSSSVLHEVADLMPRRGLVVLLSDLFYSPDELFQGLDHFLFQGHELILFHLLDPMERTLPLEGAVRFRDMETGQELMTQAHEVREAYQAAVRQWVGDLEQGCLRRAIDLVSLDTSQPLDRALVDYLMKRAHQY